MCVAVTLMMASVSQASVLMLDFGPTANPNPTISPIHSGSFTDTTWNIVGTADVTSGLLYSDGSSAVGVSYRIGTASGTTSNLAATPGSSSALGGGSGISIAGSLYGTDNASGATAARDAVFNNTTALTLQITGLAAGTYEIYYVGRNTNRNVTNDTLYTQNIFGAVATSDADFDWSGFSSSATITYPMTATPNTTTWVQGETFAVLTLTVSGPSDYINLAFTGTGGETRGFLNSLQFVAVPEPSTYAMLFGGLVALVLIRRKKKAVS